MEILMKITDVFHLSDGRSAFTLANNGLPKLIRAGTYELRRDGEAIEVVQVENEVLVGTRRGPPVRSVSTVGRANIPSGPPERMLELVFLRL